MKRNPKKIWLSIQRITTLFVLCLLTVGNLSAQYSVITKEPNSDKSAFVTIGYRVGTFSIIVTDTVSDPLTVSKFAFTLPSGINFVSGSLTVSKNGIAIPATLIGNIISTSIPLQAHDSATLSFQLSANCSAIPDAVNGFSINLKNSFYMTYTYKGVTSTTLKATETSSYPVLFPALQVQTPVSPDNSKTVQWKQNVVDTIPVYNIEGAGSTKNMTFTMQYPDATAISVSSIDFIGTSGTPVNALIASNTGGKVTVSITPILLAAMGFTDSTVHENQSFRALVKFHVNSYFSNLQTTYTMQFGADATTCNAIGNATGIMYYVQPYPAPILDAEFLGVTPTNLCGQTGQFTLKVSNIANDSISNTALHVTLPFNLNNIVLLTATLNGTPLTIQNNSIQLPSTDIDGAGVGLEDINGDGLFDDLSPNQSFQFNCTYKYIATSTFTGSQVAGIVSIVTAQKLNQSTVQVFPNLGTFINDKSLTATGSADIDKDIPTTFYANYNYSPFNQLLTEPITTSIVCQGQKTTVANYSGSNVAFTFIPTCGVTPFPATLVFETAGCSNTFTLASYSLNPYIHGCIPPLPPKDTTVSNPGSGDSTVVTPPTTPCSTVLSVPAQTNADKSIVYTGDSFTISSNASFAISGDCTDSYNTIVVQVYALSGDDILEHNVLTGTLFVNGSPHTATPVINGGNFTYTFSGFTLSGTSSLLFSQSYTIQVKHFAFNVKLENIRVGYTIGKFNDSRGAMITVVNPELNIDTYRYGNSNYDDELFLSISPGAKLSTYKNAIHVNSVTLPFVSGLDYDINTITIYKNFIQIQSTGITTNADGSIKIPINMDFKPNENVAVFYRHLPKSCVTDNTPVFEPPIPINYNDFTHTTSAANYTNKTKSSNGWVGTIYAPNLIFHPTPTQQSVTDTTVWGLDVENKGSILAKNVLIRLEPDVANVVPLTIVKVTDADGNSLPLIPLNGVWYVTINNIDVSKQKELNVVAKAFNCTNKGTSIINVQGAWSNATLSTSNFAQYACPAFTTQLKLDNLAAVLTATETFPKEAYEFGAVIPVKLDIKNTGRANLTELGFWFTKIDTNSTTLINKTVNWKFKENQSSIVNTKLSKGYLLLNSNQIISDMPLINQNKQLLGNDSIIHLNFNIQYHCGGLGTTVVPIEFITKAISNCGELQQKTFKYRPQIKGFEGLNYITVHASIQNATTYKGTSIVDISVKNTGSVLVDSAFITMIIPEGVSLQSATPAAGTIIVNTTTTTNADKTKTIEWELDQTQHIKAGETVSVTATLKDNADCPDTLSNISVMGTLKRTLIDVSTGAKCQVSESTNDSVITMKRFQKPFKPILTGSPEACVNDNISYTVTGDDVGTVVWNISPIGVGTITGSGTSASVKYNQTGTATITATVTSLSCPNHTVTLNTSTLVSDKPVVTISGPDTIKYTKWLSDGLSLFTVDPVGGTWTKKTGPADNACGTYTYTYTATNKCGSSSKSITFTIIKCCGSNPDLVETPEMLGVTTYDVEILRYYLAHPEALQKQADGSFILTILDGCGVTTLVPLKPCFLEWADINGDDKVNATDVEALKQLVK